jgi:DHA1 family bicyclomycin/chloramphenicol resistance-like MFS transporter
MPALEDKRSAMPRIGMLSLLALLIGFASISTDMYLPAMQVMSVEFGTIPSRMALSLTGFLMGFSVGQLIWGPLGDRYGRRGPITMGIILFVAGSAGCALSHEFWQLVACRVLQAFGACAAPVLARATVRDLYGPEKSAQVFSMLIAIMCIAPLAAPLAGGQILRFWSWQVIFWVLCLVGATALVGLRWFPESLPSGKRLIGGWSSTFNSYRIVATDPIVLGYGISGGCYYAGIFAYVAGTPFVYTTYYSVSPQYFGILFALGVFGTALSNVANSRMIPRYGSKVLLNVASCWAAVFGVALAVQTWTGWGGLPAVLVLVVAFIGTGGFITANAAAAALAGHAERAGTASAFIGTVQFACAMLSTAMLGWFARGTPWTFGWIIALCGLGCFAGVRLSRLILSPDNRPAPPPGSTALTHPSSRARRWLLDTDFPPTS